MTTLDLLHCKQRALAGETKQPCIRAPQCAMHACLQKAPAMSPNAIFFLLHCGTKPQMYGLVLVCFSLSCNLGTISLSRVTFHVESEKHAVSSPPLKHPACKFDWSKTFRVTQVSCVKLLDSAFNVFFCCCQFQSFTCFFVKSLAQRIFTKLF